MPGPKDAILIPRKFTAHYLRRFSFKAETLFDVGVGTGTPELYRLFQGRKLVLIDPLADTPERIRKRWPALAFDFIAAALGGREGSAFLNITRTLSKTGLAERTALTAEEIVERRRVRLTTLDQILAQSSYPAPFGLKLDAEGFELEILRGGTKALEQTEFVIAEVSIKKRFVGGYRFSDIVGFLGERGFELIDILNFGPATQRFYDCLFLGRDHPLFAERAGASRG